MNDNLKISIIQTDILWENIEGNLQNFSKLISEINQQVDIVLLPEMFTTGFSMQTAKLAENMNDKTISWFRQTAKKTNAAISGTAIIEENGKYFNRLIWMQPDGQCFHYDKHHLFRMSDEEKYFSSGSKSLIINYKNWRIKTVICYDLRFPVWLRNQNNYDLLLVLANWPKPRIEVWNTLLKARAIENQCYVAAVNRIGNDENANKYSGNSAIIDFKGNVINALTHDESIISAEISKSDLSQFREKFPAWLDADTFILQ